MKTIFYGKCAVICGRRAFSPGARHRPVRNDNFRERRPVPSPVKKPRMETHPYQEPERRPMARPVHKMAPEPKPSYVAVIEKRPVLFNPSAASVAEFPPLPQRKPVQRPLPKPAPQKPEPVKNVPQKAVPVKNVPQRAVPVKNVPQNAVPVKNVPQNAVPVKNVPQNAVPVKNVPQNAVPVKNVPQKMVPVKTVPQKVVQTQQKPEAKPAPKQPEAKASEDKVPGSDAATPHQLDAVTQRVLDDELQEIATKTKRKKKKSGRKWHRGSKFGMFRLPSYTKNKETNEIIVKVAQELQWEAPPGAERLVAGRLRAKAGDDIKNALGLNVTKRLVDQHNPLYVKLVFSGKPEPGRLQPFIAAWRIGAFKRIASPGDTFAARLDAVEDFDRLCQAKEVTCGSAKVTVTPCYKFLACPATVKSAYAIEEANENPDSNNTSPQKQPNAEATEVNTADNKTSKDDSGKEVNKAAVTSKDDSGKEVNKTEVTCKDSSDKEVDKTEKSEVKDVGKASEAKSETHVNNTKVASSPVTVNITIEAQSKPDEVDKKTSKEVPKLEVEKKSTNTTEVNNKATTQNNAVDKTKVVKETMVVDEHANDDVEMSDHDILALMSGGIVLDECSGSEDEKE